MGARVLITGASGFAGPHLVRACEEAGDRVIAVSRSTGVDLTDAAAARAIVRASEPDVVHHLAGLASVGGSWEEPERWLQVNSVMALNLLEAVRTEAPGARVVLVSSGQVYGRPRHLPVGEDGALAPESPYAVAKATVDLLGGMYAETHGLWIIRARAFNHAGPGQSADYIVASLARQVAAVQGADGACRIVTGNADARRDFTDVRDVVEAYRALAATAEPGVYNVCSGRSTSVAELVALAGAAAGCEVEHEVDPALVREHELMDVRGSHAALTAATGWEPTITLEQTLADTVQWWVGELDRERGAAL